MLLSLTGRRVFVVDKKAKGSVLNGGVQPVREGEDREGT